MKRQLMVGLGAALLVGALAVSTVNGAFPKRAPPVPGGMMGGSGMMGLGQAPRPHRCNRWTRPNRPFSATSTPRKCRSRAHK